MTLVWNWRAVLKKAWSVRLWLCALVLDVVSIVLTVNGAFSHDKQAALTLQIIGALLGASGLLARVFYQRSVSNGVGN